MVVLSLRRKEDAEMDEKLTAFFGSNAKMVGDYFAKAPAGPERDARMSRATKAAETKSLRLFCFSRLDCSKKFCLNRGHDFTL
jgi:hypothetical protein